MAGTYSPTGTYSNLTRLELEALRRADFTAGGKAVTVGDSGLPPEGVVGKGDVNAEPFYTGPSLLVEEIYGVRPPALPGTLLGSTTQPAALFAETAKWYGPIFVLDDTRGTRVSGTRWGTNDPGVDFVAAGVQVGDVILVMEQPVVGPTGSLNTYGTAVVSAVTSSSQLTCTTITNPANGTPTQWGNDGKEYSYLIIRPSAVQLFAVPGSGPLGREQTFLAVVPGSSLHSQSSPTTDQINADRVRDLVLPVYAQDSSADRADAVYGSPAPRSAADKLGYRIVLYPDNGSGTGPDLTLPITSLNPVINSSLPSTDQRFTVDHRAGVIRFSCAPQTGDDIKPSAGCVDATTGRLNLYAVFWAVDLTLTSGVAKGLWATRGLPGLPRSPGRLRYSTDTARPRWLIGETGAGNDLFVEAPDVAQDYRRPTRLGVRDTATGGFTPERYFAYYSTTDLPFNQRVWRMLTRRSSVDQNRQSAHELEVGDRTEVTVSDSSAPPTAPGLYNPTSNIGSSSGGRWSNFAMNAALGKLAEGQFSRIKLRRGTHRMSGSLHIPPGVVIEGEGDATVVRSEEGTAFVFGPNTNRGVWEQPSTDVLFPATQRIEGIDVVWNPVRRVWGYVIADLTSQAVWFNEMQVDGTLRFPGLGVDVKDTATPLFSSASPNSQDHTAGHYPRLAHCTGTNEYLVVWVQESVVGPDTGPHVYMQSFSVSEPDDPTASDPQPTKPALTVEKKYPSPQSIVSGHTWSDHPSIAVNNDASSDPEFVVTLWGYSNLTPGNYVSFSARVFAAATAGSLTVNSVPVDSVGAAGVVSSTDAVVDSQNMGFLTAWSVRTHSLITGTAGKWTLASGGGFPDPGHSYLTDAGVGNFQSKGVGPGSKFLYLGVSLPPTYVTGYLLDAPPPTGLSLTLLPSYGDDGVVYEFDSSNPARPRIKCGRDGRPYNTYSSNLLAAGPGGVTAIGGNVLSDPAADFVAAGVAVGDKLIVVTGPNAGEYEVQGSIATNSFVITGTFPANDGATDYLVFVGRPFRFAVAPRCYIESRRSVSLTGTEQPKQLVAGGTVPGTATTYEFGEYEADFVRLGAAEDKFLVAYQNMNTTGRLSKDYLLGDGGLNWSPAPADNFIFLREYTACYREHVSTAAAVLRWDGLPADEVRDSISVNLPEFDEARARPMTQLRRSLGTRSFIGSRPNWRDITGTEKDGQQMAVEVSCLNWFHRWTTSQAPSLLPDVTWNGRDFVVASPSKSETRSFLGNYIVDGSGVVTLNDATVYFGDGQGLGQPSNGAVTRPTLSGGDLIYFPSINKGTTVAAVLGSHSIQLADADIDLLQIGVSTAETNVEWVLVREMGAQHGPKNPGFRVSLEGEVLAQASYMTFAEELEDRASLDDGLHPRTTLMNRTGGSDRFVDGIWVTSGVNYPATTVYDAPTGARWKADIGFRGPAVGQSKGTSYLQPGETSLVSLAWGETMYAALDRELAGGDGTLSNVVNKVNVSRQSFGPYMNGLENMRIEGNPRTALVAGVQSPLTLESQQHVWTRHGDPTGSQGFFATDGARACFVFAGRRNEADAVDLATFSTVNSFENYPHGVFAVYTDALGLDPVRVEGPRSWLKSPNPVPWFYQDAPFAQEFYSGIVAGVSREVYPSLAAAPRVVWDGRAYAAAWWETSTLSNEPATLRFTFFPGADQTAMPMDEMVSPADIMGQVRACQQVQPSVGLGSVVGSVDLATSGKTYAAAWTLGMDRNSGGPTASNGAMVGITIFTPSTSGDGHVYDCEPNAYYGTGNGTSNPGYLGADQDQDFKYGYMTTSTAVDFSGMTARGDILIITSGTAVGRYRVLDVDGTDLYLDRWIPSTTFGFTLHKPKAPPGAKTYLLDIHPAVGQQRVKLGPPVVIWDGQRYVVAWRSGGTSENGLDADHLMVAAVGEDGIGAPSYVLLSENRGSFLAGQSSMLLELNTASPQKVYFGGGTLVSVTSGGLTAASTIVAPGGTNWITEGVVPGCIVLFGDSGNREIYVAQSVTAANIVVDRALHQTGAHPVSVRAWMAVPRIKPGDVFRLSVADYDGTLTATPGTMRVLDVNPALHHVRIEAGLASTGTTDVAYLFGDVVNEGKGSELGANDDLVTDQGFSPAAVVPRLLGRTNTDFARIGRVYGMAYVEQTGEYVALIGNDLTGNSNSISLVSFSLRGLQAQRAVQVSTGSTHLISALGWNGTHLLVVWATDNATASATGLRYALYDAHLRPVGQSQALRDYTDFQGAGAGETPGDGVIAASVSAAPARFRNVQVRWNAELCRWMVSVSMSTYFDGTPTQDVASYQLPPERRMGNVTVVAVSGNTVTLDHGGSNETTWITAGCKLVFRFNYIAGGGAAQPELVAEVLHVNYNSALNQARVILSTAYFPRTMTTYVAGDISIAPREDVFLLTLGYPDPSIVLVDPDGVHLEGVTLTGGADISARWKHLGRTFWKASGPMIGATLKRRLYQKQPLTLAGDTASTMQKPQWMPVFRTPRSLGGPDVGGIRSQARNRYRKPFSPR